MSRTVIDLDEEALSLASEELGTKSKVIPLAWITRAAAAIMLLLAGLSLAAAVS